MRSITQYEAREMQPYLLMHMACCSRTCFVYSAFEVRECILLAADCVRTGKYRHAASRSEHSIFRSFALIRSWEGSKCQSSCSIVEVLGFGPETVGLFGAPPKSRVTPSSTVCIGSASPNSPAWTRRSPLAIVWRYSTSSASHIEFARLLTKLVWTSK